VDLLMMFLRFALVVVVAVGLAALLVWAVEQLLPPDYHRPGKIIVGVASIVVLIVATIHFLGGV
jgi:hypothetical protein